MTNPIRYGLDRISMALATKTNFISRFGAEEFHRPGDDEHVVYNGIPDPPPISRPQEILETDLLYVGTGNHRKRVNMLPFVLREVQSRLNRPVSLRTVGFDRRSWPEMFHIADELGVTESIVCEGPMTSAKVQGFYAKSKLLIVPSAYEGLPLVIGEAQKAGLPCVATNVCAHPEIIVPEENGLLVPLDSVEGFAAAVCRLLSDEPLRQSMAKAAVARSRELFSLERQVELYCRLYDSLSRSFEDNARSQGRALADVEN
jgi:glycosyltransferase involved in cell wall biosynthesis